MSKYKRPILTLPKEEALWECYHCGKLMTDLEREAIVTDVGCGGRGETPCTVPISQYRIKRVIVKPAEA